MSYFERYKIRTQRALNCKESLLKDAEYRFQQVMDEALTTHIVQYTKNGEFPDLKKNGTIRVNINDITNNDKSAYDEKKILVDKNADMDVGSYIWFNNCWWIAVFKEHQSLNLYKKLIFKVCNQIVKYKLNGTTYDIPVNIHNMTLKCRVSYHRNMVYENWAKSVKYMVTYMVRKAKSIFYRQANTELTN